MIRWRWLVILVLPYDAGNCNPCCEPICFIQWSFNNRSFSDLCWIIVITIFTTHPTCELSLLEHVNCIVGVCYQEIPIDDLKNSEGLPSFVFFVFTGECLLYRTLHLKRSVDRSGRNIIRLDKRCLRPSPQTPPGKTLNLKPRQVKLSTANPNKYHQVSQSLVPSWFKVRLNRFADIRAKSCLLLLLESVFTIEFFFVTVVLLWCQPVRIIVS